MSLSVFIDAFSFNGFTVWPENTIEGYHNVGAVGFYAAKSKGRHLPFKNSGGDYLVSNSSEELIGLDVAACVSKNRDINKKYSFSPIESILFVFLEEMCHWADSSQKDNTHSDLWFEYLAKMIRDLMTKVNG